jgi:hypothetical protein
VPPTVLDDTPPPLRHARCYLAGYGNCSDKITKEHFISRNILERLAPLRFENAGHFFGGKQVVEVGVDSFSAKVLCDAHNGALSPLDAAAGQTFQTIQALGADLLGVADPNRRLAAFYVGSGIDMERWLIKVFLGLVAAGKIRAESSRVLSLVELPPELFDAMLGRAALPPPLGLYVAAYPGQQFPLSGLSFSTLQLTDGSDAVGGMMLRLGVLDFILVTSPNYGSTFSNDGWFRHHPMPWSVEQNGSKAYYALTY